VSHPATSIHGVTFVQNVGTPQERVITQTSVPLERRQMLTSTASKPAEIARVFNGAMEDLHAATLGSRSIPFGGPLVILQGIAFTNTKDIILPHHLKSAKAMLLMLAHPRLLTAGIPFAVVQSAAGVLLVDDRTITLSALGTFTADVVLGLGP
jgi:hypothetical protein